MFTDNAWVNVMLAAMVVALGLTIRYQYRLARRRIEKFDDVFPDQPFDSVANPPSLAPDAPTAAFIVGSGYGGGLHTLPSVQRMFPNHFRNFVFVYVRALDKRSNGEESLSVLKQGATIWMSNLVNFCNSDGLAARYYLAFDTDPVPKLVTLAKQVVHDFPAALFFGTELIIEDEDLFTRLFRNQAPHVLQRRLHLEGMQMAIVPMSPLDVGVFTQNSA